ncbi:hypothetical protein [Clostridiisalibacter paucivorans]|uniref:hypothetical protein n=1 Tax=Clostridiisalibacter paucivorans TaxID=408753 RepID=UPI0004793BEB|nr:hypothetical protein [Clostridiisalibacter paucivorans]
MASRLLKEESKTFSGMKLTQYVNEENGTNFDNIVEAVAGLGIAAVGAAVTNPMASAIATALGLALAIDAVIDAVTEALDDSDLESTIKKMDEGDSLKVITKFYEWSSGSGNHYTWYSEEEFEIV